MTESSPFNRGDTDEAGQHVDMSTMANHDSLYSNPRQAAEFLIGKYDEETAREHFEERGYDADFIDEIINDALSEGDNEYDVDKSEPSYEDVIDALDEAFEKSSWWEATEYREGAELSKSPGIWRRDDTVPEAVTDLIRQVIESTRWDWATFESLDPGEADELKDLLKEKLTQPQGWSLESVATDVQDEFGLPENVAVGMSADTTHNVLCEATMEAYDRMEGSEDFVYDWIGPDDHRTTPVCKEIMREIDQGRGRVSASTLNQILLDKARKYVGDHAWAGTPRRVKHWQPHRRCRCRPLVAERSADSRP